MREKTEEEWVTVRSASLHLAVKNIRMSVRQGDKFAMELFSYGMDPILYYLERRLQGILVHSLPVQGPVLLPAPPTPAPPDPPKIPGLPDLPPAPPAPGRRQRALLMWTLPPIETRYILFAYCDDLKPAVTSRWEFLLVERVMTIFEMASGCKMHRTAESQKCKFLPLGKWKTELTQIMIPHGFFSLSDHLDFLGVTLKTTFSSTRKANGDILQERIKNVIGPWKGGLFMPLNKRSHSVNMYAFSKLLYRCNVIDPRVADITCFKSTAKSFVYAGLLEKPEEITLHCEVKDGGLGLLHIESRAKAALITTFLQTAINPNFKRNYFHNTLFRQYVLDEHLNAPKIPPNFTGDFFPTIRKLASSSSKIELSTIKTVYNFLMLDLLNDDPIPGETITMIAH